jgi:hypothetical protein
VPTRLAYASEGSGRSSYVPLASHHNFRIDPSE